MTDNGLVLSTSSISEYLRCNYRYFLSHVYRLRGQQNMAAAIGQAVHAGVEQLHHEERGDWGVVTAQDALRAAFEHEMASVPISEQAADPDALQDGEKMLGVYRRDVLPAFHPTLIEAPFTFRVDGVIVSGTIDAADEDVRDLKTTSGKTINGRKPHFSPENYDQQLSLYAMGYQALTGKRPQRLLLDVLTRRGTYRQYEREPKISETLDVLGVVRDGIVREEFSPTGALSGACRWCPFINVCSYTKP